MQPEVITLGIDVANDSTIVNYDFTRYDSYQNRTVYIADAHVQTARDTLTLYRTTPKPSGNFRGTTKTAFKFSKDYIVDGVDGVSQLSAPAIVEVSFAIPVGVSTANMLFERQKALALLDLDAVVGKLVEIGLI